MKNGLVTILITLISPTYVRASILKCTSSRENDERRAYTIKKLNTEYLIISVIFAITLSYFNILYKFSNIITPFILFSIIYFSFSRVNEIFIAFLNDAKDKMEYKPPSGKGLKYTERLMLALKSYVELMINYGMIYYILNTDVFKSIYLNRAEIYSRNFRNLIEAIYFSATTITTLGYGDITPISNVTQILSVYEVINGLLLIVVSFTIYVQLNFLPEHSLKEVINRKSVKNKVKFNSKISLITIILFILYNAYIINSYVKK